MLRIAPETVGHRPMASATRARPPLFRALGASEPPSVVVVRGETYALHELMKHDSWAATGIYRGPNGVKITCKFNRIQTLLGLSMKWLGQLLAANQRMTLERLADCPGVPDSLGDVFVNGEHWPNAI